MLACRTVIRVHNLRTDLLFLDRSMIKCKRHGQMRDTAVPSCHLNSIPVMEHTCKAAGHLEALSSEANQAWACFSGVMNTHLKSFLCRQFTAACAKTIIHLGLTSQAQLNERQEVWVPNPRLALHHTSWGRGDWLAGLGLHALHVNVPYRTPSLMSEPWRSKSQAQIQSHGQDDLVIAHPSSNNHWASLWEEDDDRSQGDEDKMSI